MDTVGHNIGASSPEAATRSARPMTNFKRMLGNSGPVVLLTLGSLWLIQGTLARSSGHGIVLRGTRYNAGTVKAGTMISHQIRLINLSVQPLELEPEPGCSCTVVDTPNRPLAPLHTEVITAHIDTDGMAVGSHRKGVILHLHTGFVTWERLAAIEFQLR